MPRLGSNPDVSSGLEMVPEFEAIPSFAVMVETTVRSPWDYQRTTVAKCSRIPNAS